MNILLARNELSQMWNPRPILPSSCKRLTEQRFSKLIDEYRLVQKNKRKNAGERDGPDNRGNDVMEPNLSVILPLILAYILTAIVIVYYVADEIQKQANTADVDDEEYYWMIASMPVCHGLIPPLPPRAHISEKRQTTITR